MLNILGKDVQNLIIKIILGLIALVFVFWGFGGYNTRTSVLVASVNGKDITRTEYENVYERMLANFKNQLKQFQGDFSQELLNKLNFRQRALDEVIKKILLEQEAKNLNISVTNQEIKEAIRNYPEFQENGNFNLEKYKHILKQSRIRPADFEEGRKDMLILSKVENIVTDSVQISEVEALNEYKRRNEKISIDFVLFNPVEFKDKVKVTDDDLKEYFDKNSSAFDLPSMVKAQVLAFENDDFSKKAEIKDNEIKEYYEKNKSNFIQEEKAKASHILIKSEIGDDPQIRDDAREKAKELLVKLETGEEFTELAKKYSQDAKTAERGGDMGWFERGKMDKSFDDAVFSLQIDEVSGVVESKDGYHIIKLTDKKEEKVKELDSVKDKITKTLSLIKGKKMIDTFTRLARKEVFITKDLAGYAKKYNLKLITPPPFALNDKVESIGKNIVFNRAVFEIEPGEVSDIIDLDRGSYIVKVVEKIASKTPEFAEVKESVNEKVVEDKSNDLAESKADEALRKVQEGKPLEVVAKEYDLSVGYSGNFPREGASAPKIGVSEELVNAAFGLSSEKPFPNKIFNVNNNFYLIRFADKDEILMDDYKKEKALLLKQLRMEKADRVFASYVEGLIEKADIKLYEEL
jgi:peptidyl-prolyl cis-trans isomerase D